MRAILAPSARKDIKKILLWSSEKFGRDAALRYEALLVQAVRDIEADPERPGVSRRADLPADVSLYHVALSRSRVSGVSVKEPRHFLVFLVKASRLDIVRVLHDSRDLDRHLSAMPGTGE